MNIYGARIINLLQNVNVCWHVFGVAAIVADPLPRARAITRARASSSRTASTTPGFVEHVLVLRAPAGFLLTQYTITGFDASAHVSEETAEARPSRRPAASGSRSSTRRSAAGSCCSHSSSRRPTWTQSEPRAEWPGILTTALSSFWAKSHPDHRVRRTVLLRHELRDGCLAHAVRLLARSCRSRPQRLAASSTRTTTRRTRRAPSRALRSS